MKRIFLDLDGVLADFVTAVATFHNRDPQLVVCYGLEQCWDIDNKSLWEPLGFDFWANLPLTAEADEIVAMCYEAVGKSNVGILTSPCRTRGCTDGKLAWVRKHFPRLARQCLVGSAKYMCASPQSLLVDDNKDKCDLFSEHSGHAFLFPRRWNENRHLAHEPMPQLRRFLDMFMQV